MNGHFVCFAVQRKVQGNEQVDSWKKHWNKLVVLNKVRREYAASGGANFQFSSPTNPANTFWAGYFLEKKYWNAEHKWHFRKTAKFSQSAGAKSGMFFFLRCADALKLTPHKMFYIFAQQEVEEEPNSPICAFLFIQKLKHAAFVTRVQDAVKTLRPIWDEESEFAANSLLSCVCCCDVEKHRMGASGAQCCTHRVYQMARDWSRKCWKWDAVMEELHNRNTDS